MKLILWACIWLIVGGTGSVFSNSLVLSNKFTQTQTQTIQVPGPSAALYASPYYTCTTNLYVSITGSDSNNGTSASTPWLTLQHADSAGPTAGTCINVAPGTYSSGVNITNGGNAATSTGYVVYRCTSMDACVITDSNYGFQMLGGPATAQYVMVDGFELAASSAWAYGQGIRLDANVNGNGCTGTDCVFLTHHIWVLNSIIHGYGQSGIQLNDSDYAYVLHNTVYDNSNVTCDAQGSGISFATAKAAIGYTPTSDDQTNPNPFIGSFVNGASFFHIAIEWNVVYNNAVTNCGSSGSPYDTDGNSIILDTWNNANNTLGEYPYQGLVAFNVVYNSGGGGVLMTHSHYATIANNTCYNEVLDPYNNGSGRACISTFGGATVINNIAIGIPVSHGTCAYSTVPYAMWNNAIDGSLDSGYAADVFSNNITDIFGGNTSCQGETNVWGGDSYSATANKKATNPLWVGVGNSSAGTETTQPVGTNFALQPGSPAIGYGLTESYLPPSSVDAGACSSTLSTCP